MSVLLMTRGSGVRSRLRSTTVFSIGTLRPKPVPLAPMYGQPRSLKVPSGVRARSASADVSPSSSDGLMSSCSKRFFSRRSLRSDASAPNCRIRDGCSYHSRFSGFGIFGLMMLLGSAGVRE
jgi:hypothetical protein